MPDTCRKFALFVWLCPVRQVNHGADKLIGRKYDILKVLTTYLTEFSTYVRQNPSSIVDYLDQHGYKNGAQRSLWSQRSIGDCQTLREASTNAMEQEGSASAITGAYEGLE